MNKKIIGMIILMGCITHLNANTCFKEDVKLFDAENPTDECVVKEKPTMIQEHVERKVPVHVKEHIVEKPIVLREHVIKEVPKHIKRIVEKKPIIVEKEKIITKPVIVPMPVPTIVEAPPIIAPMPVIVEHEEVVVQPAIETRIEKEFHEVFMPTPPAMEEAPPEFAYTPAPPSLRPTVHPAPKPYLVCIYNPPKPYYVPVAVYKPVAVIKRVPVPTPVIKRVPVPTPIYVPIGGGGGGGGSAGC